jgi:hypothetical protein
MVEELSEAPIPNPNKTRMGAKTGRSGSKFNQKDIQIPRSKALLLIHPADSPEYKRQLNRILPANTALTALVF